jgi:hypothetical protein
MLTSVIPSIFLGRTLNVIDIDARALMVASAFGALAVLLSGVLPAWKGTSAGIAWLGSRSSTAAMTTPLTRVLLVSQIALALVLMIGSALLVRSFVNIVHADRGMNADGVLRAMFSYPNTRTDAFGKGLPAFPNDTPEARRVRTATVAEQLGAWPEISAFAFSNRIMPRSADDPVAIRSDQPGAQAIEMPVESYAVTSPFFEVYEIPVLRGRTFEAVDSLQDVIVSERLATVLWPELDPIGRSFVLGPKQVAHRVIGVAGEITLPALEAGGDAPEFYQPFPAELASIVQLSVRCRRECPPAQAFDARIQAVHPAIVVTLRGPVEETFLARQELPRAIAQVAGVFAVVAVLTAAGGLFSVLTYAVGRRRREYGIRTALGASPRQMRWLVVRDGLTIVALGAAIGALGGWMAGRALTSLQYGVTATDPLTWTAVLGTIAITSLIAAWRPARQAMRVDPVRLLREE